MNILRIKGTSWVAYEKNFGILIDTGMRNDSERILKKIDALGIRIPLIFLTHTHYDHAGSAEQIRKAIGAKVIVSAKEAKCLRQGHTPVPKGTGLLGNMLGKAAHSVNAKRREHYLPVIQDIIEINQEESLKQYGFDAKAIPLGAHSIGSIGLKIGDNFFVGDTVFSVGGIIYPVFADFVDEISDAWRKILQSGAKYIYPGHGKMLKVSCLKTRYRKWFEA